MKKILLILLLILLIASSGCIGRHRENGSGPPTITPTTGPEGQPIVTSSRPAATSTPCKELNPLIILVEFPD
ncbi:MAG TPA: hypothetical protein PLS25_08530, partial [Methanoregulaceae archaeon]|nr:hypothetical protein [Methanoregulaceae archaeon]